MSQIKIVPGEDITTQIKVLKVNSGKYGVSLDCDIPGMGSREFKFIDWRDPGPPPKAGEKMLGTLRHKKRSEYYMKQGVFVDSSSSEVTGEESPWHLDWEMIAVEPLADAPARQTVGGSSGGAVFLDGNLRYRVSEEMVNDREAIRMAVQFGCSDNEEVLAIADRFARWLNTRLAARLSGGSVGALQEMGATVTGVTEKEPEGKAQLEENPTPRKLKNRAELQDWVSEMGWSRDDVLKVLTDNGYEDSKQYLKQGGNNPQSLAALLEGNLRGDSEDIAW